MRVGIDVHVLTGPPQGTASVWAHLLAALPGDATYVLYSFDPEYTRQAFPQSHFLHRAIPVHQAHARIFFSYPWMAARDRCDVFHTNYYAPLIGARRRVVTVHDLIYIDFPEFAPKMGHLQQRILGRFSAQRASHIIVDSEYARSRVRYHFGIPDDRMSVIYPGLGAEWHRPDEAAINRAWTALRPRLPLRYLVGVGRLDPRKGVVAAAAVAQSLRTEGHTDALVWVGPGDFGAGTIERALEREGLMSTVIRLVGLSTNELQAVYRHAQLLLFPSLAEGFGYPPLEAMAMGTPVVVSNRTSIPEVCGNAAIVIDPLDPGSLVTAARSVLTNPELRRQVCELGRRWVAQFTNDRMALATANVYRQACLFRRG